MTELDFDGFMASGHRNHWIVEGELDIYVRKSLTPKRGDVEIAAVSCRDPGKGHLTAFLDRIEGGYSVFFENVLASRFRKYLAGRGYKVVTKDLVGIPCMLRKKGRR